MAHLGTSPIGVISNCDSIILQSLRLRQYVVHSLSKTSYRIVRVTFNSNSTSNPGFELIFVTLALHQSEFHLNIRKRLSQLSRVAQILITITI